MFKPEPPRGHVAETTHPLDQAAWEQCYLDPQVAGAIGLQLARAGGAQAALGWLHVALSEVRHGELASAAQALQDARAAYGAASDATGLAWCDEVQAIALRREGDYAGSAALQAELDQRPQVERDAMFRFVSQNSRAITAKLLGNSDSALRHFYAAAEAADDTGLAGPRITALSNLGGYHHDLFNLDDARALSEQALEAARLAGARPALANAAGNLITIYHALGEAAKARAVVEYLLTHEGELVSGTLQRAALSLALGHLSVGEIEAAQHHLEAGAVSALADGDGMLMWAWIKARCLLARDAAAPARAVAEEALRQRRESRLCDPPYDRMELHKVLADACERLGDHAAALRYMREVHALYEQLVGRSVRARYIALEVSHQLAAAQHERDQALDSRRSADDDRHRLARLNAALRAQIEQTDMLHAQLREQALNDPLTTLHNRRFLFEATPKLLELARRQDKPLCVALIDLDHFKLLNDTYGHAVGDLVLQRFAKLLTQMLRRSDVVCRYGGEEFVAIMPELDGDSAQAVLTRLLEAFQALPPEPGQRRTPNASFSAGIALFPRHGNTLEQLLSRADRALYAAKHHGRARIEQVPRTGFSTLT